MKYIIGTAGTALKHHGSIVQVYTNGYYFQADNGARFNLEHEADFEPDIITVYQGGRTEDGIPDGGDVQYETVDKDGKVIGEYLGDDVGNNPVVM